MQSVDEDARHASMGCRFGELELRVLEGRDRLAEDLPLVDVLDRLVERALHRRDAGDRDQQPLVRQVAHQLVHALAFLLQQAVDGHAHVLEEQFRGVLGVEAHLVEHAADAVALEARGLDHQDRKPRLRSLGSVRTTSISRPALPPLVMKILEPLIDVVVAIAHGARADALEVRPRARLGHRDRTDQLAARHARQPALLLLLGAVIEHVVRRNTVHAV